MKRIFSVITCCIFAIIAFAQSYKIPEYNITSIGHGTRGSYLVRVTALVKNTKTSKDDLQKCGIHGIMFRGYGATDQYPAHGPLVKDPNIENTKADFFNAFFKEYRYKGYCTLQESSLRTVKVKGGYEISINMVIDKERLLSYLNESGIISGSSDLY